MAQGVPSHDGPFSSGDGRVILYPPLSLPDDVFMVVQTALPAAAPTRPRRYWPRLPRAPASAATVDYAGASIAIQYFGMDVLLAGQPEKNLKLYRWDGARAAVAVHRTQPGTERRFGAYARHRSLRPHVQRGDSPLLPGLERLSLHDSSATRPVSQAPASIDGYDSHVYGYDAFDLADPWKLYVPAAPAWVSDLQNMVYGNSYWISATQAITVFVDNVAPVRAGEAAGARQALSAPPATFYGHVAASEEFVPGAGLPVTAFVGTQQCGMGSTLPKGMRWSTWWTWRRRRPSLAAACRAFPSSSTLPASPCAPSPPGRPGAAAVGFNGGTAGATAVSAVHRPLTPSQGENSRERPASCPELASSHSWWQWEWVFCRQPRPPAVPLPPATVWGRLTIMAPRLPTGTRLGAQIGGVEYNAVATQTQGETAGTYVIDVPADDPFTPAVEVALQGRPFTLPATGC